MRHGRETLEGTFNHCAAAGVTATVENGVADEDRAAFTPFPPEEVRGG